MNTKYIIGSVSGAVIGLALVGTACAQTPQIGARMGMNWGRNASSTMQMHGMPMQRPGVAGTVASVSGTTITVTSRGFGKTASTSAATTYTVNASSATVMKNNATSSVSAIAVGDMVFVQGTVSGTNVTATKILDGAFPMMGGKPGANMQHASSTPIMAGNGEPVVGGKVSAVSGMAISITNSGNTTYTVDVSGAKVQKAGVQSATASNIAVGDEIIVQGTVNGNAITATSVIDQTAVQSKPAGHGGGILGSIGSLFKRIFGF